ncbi:hypothetical protein VNI00_011528 [Paramarasmius palmivorus]|uniref:Uncharacterized protein n=1 Tax=Paramarasmius palmivorus TaxID=297713 RepID=A0AAW0CBE2_9AGAR
MPTARKTAIQHSRSEGNLDSGNDHSSQGATERDAVQRSRSQKSVIVLEDSDNDSSASVVSVSRKARPRSSKIAPVHSFGSVESDDEVHVPVRDRRPKNVELKPKTKVVEKEKARGEVLVPSSDVDEEVLSGADSDDNTPEPFVVVDRKRRPIMDDKLSHISSIQLIPLNVAKMSKAVSGATDEPVTPKSGGRRIGTRVRKPTAKALDASGEHGDLLSNLPERLDEKLEDLDGAVGQGTPRPDSTYVPTKPRGTVKSRSVRPKRGSEKKQPSSPVGSDVEMGSPPRASPPWSGEFRSLTDSEEELPSPTLVLARKKVPTKILPPTSKVVEPVVSDGPVVARTVASVETADRMKASVAEQPRKALTVKPSGSSAKEQGSVVTKAVFSAVVPFPDDEDDGGSADEEIDSPGLTEDPLLDVDHIHPDLLELYQSLSWINGLRRSRFIGYPNTEDAFDDFAAASYGGISDTSSPRVRGKFVRSVLFIEYKDFKNPARVPLATFSRHWECLRVPRGDGNRNAALVMTGVCMQSFVAQGREVGSSYVKQLHVRPIENDWVVFQANVGTYFNDDRLHAPGRRSLLVFQTKREGWSPRQFDRDNDKLASTPYSSPSKDTGSKARSGGQSSTAEQSNVGIDIAKVNILERGAPPYRLFDEGIPIYDGRTKPGQKGFRFEAGDWENYTQLPVYPHPEVELSSLLTVVFTLTGFRGTTNVHHTVHFNALFAIVLGKVDG